MNSTAPTIRKPRKVNSTRKARGVVLTEQDWPLCLSEEEFRATVARLNINWHAVAEMYQSPDGDIPHIAVHEESINND